MAITELNGGCSPCALALNDSLLSFPSMDGLVWVDLSRPLHSLQEGNIYIDEFCADGRKINKGSLFRPRLSSGTRELSFSLRFPAPGPEADRVWRGKLYVCREQFPYRCALVPGALGMAAGIMLSYCGDHWDRRPAHPSIPDQAAPAATADHGENERAEAKE